MLDVETATQDRATICQIGIALFAEGALKSTWGSLVNPDVRFAAINVKIHGITEETVRGSPRWPEVYAQVCEQLGELLIVSHTPFDQTAVSRACARYGLAEPNNKWADSCKIARTAWPELASHSLPTVAKSLGIKYRKHDAIEDARCAGEVMLRAITQLDVFLPACAYRHLPTIGLAQTVELARQ